MTHAAERTMRLLDGVPGPDKAARAATAERAARVLRPAGALARLDEIAVWLAGWQRTDCPAVREPVALVFAADHGVVAESVSAYPPSVTASVVKAIEEGVATSSVLARMAGVDLAVVNVGVGLPTGNMAHEPAMSEERFLECLAAGREAVASRRTDLLVLGEMGIGNTTVAAGICVVLFGGSAADWTGPGAGLDPQGVAHKARVVETARQRTDAGGPLDVLRDVGGAELVALVGAVVEARRRSIPVVLDGYVVTAAAAPLQVVQPGALDHCVSAHRAAEPGHGRLLDRLGMRPLLDLEMRLGEGSGALLAVPLIRMAAAAVTEVATLDEWGVTPS
jgi:nicotinate-nucleotide--dimethylbenzimidazole phosphoribosyltransferase